MSHARKHIHELLETAPVTDFLTEDHTIVQIVSATGGNLFKAQMSPNSNTPIVVLLPSKFSKLLWLRRGTFCAVRLLPAEEVDNANVHGIIEHVLVDEHIEEMISENILPDVWMNTLCQSDSDSDQDLWENPNPNRTSFFCASDSD
ncbi:hypothetical protein P9112_007397 [Eukaryota sp. TZLM1-RC]